MITSTAILTEIRAKINSRKIFFADTEIYNQPSMIGYEKRFRLQWFATQLNTFISITSFEEEPLVTEFLIKEYSQAVFQFALKNNPGWKPGFQSGIALLPVAIVSKASIDARDFCARMRKTSSWSASFLLPIVIERGTGIVYFPKERPFVGRIYYPYLRQMIEAIILEPTQRALSNYHQ